MTAQAATQTQTGRTCGECVVVNIGSEHGGEDEYEVICCPLHAQAEATARERDALLEALERYVNSDGHYDEIDSALQGVEIRKQAVDLIAAVKGGAG